VQVRLCRSGWARTSGLLGFNQALCHLSYRPAGRDAATRTPCLLVPNQAGHHIPLIPLIGGRAHSAAAAVDRLGFEPKTSCLQGRRSNQLELAAQDRHPGQPCGWAGVPEACGFGLPHKTYPAVEFSKCNHIPPRRGGDPQGRQDSNLRRAVLEAAVLAAELRPYKLPCQMKTARQDGPWGRCLRGR
jgi:hypothetical protein